MSGIIICPRQIAYIRDHMCSIFVENCYLNVAIKAVWFRTSSKQCIDRNVRPNKWKRLYIIWTQFFNIQLYEYRPYMLRTPLGQFYLLASLIRATFLKTIGKSKITILSCTLISIQFFENSIAFGFINNATSFEGRGVENWRQFVLISQSDDGCLSLFHRIFRDLPSNYDKLKRYCQCLFLERYCQWSDCRVDIWAWLMKFGRLPREIVLCT